MAQQVIRSANFSDVDYKYFKKSHELVFSQLALTPLEHDLFALMLTQLNKEHWADDSMPDIRVSPRYEFGSDVLCEWLGVEKKHIYTYIYEPSERLSSKKIGVLNDEKKKFDFIPLFQRISYEDGTLTMVPNFELMEQYLGLSKGHSQIPQGTFRSLNKEHAKRLYAMICRFKDYGKLKSFQIEELHGLFGLLNEKGQLAKPSYKSNSEFFRKLLKPTIKEISEKEAGITFHIDEKSGNFGYQPIKTGRKITGVKFLYTWNVQKAEPKPKQEALENITGRQLLLTYELVSTFEPDQPGNPSSQELIDMMNNINFFIGTGKTFDERLMVNYGMALAEAHARETEVATDS
ncbi:replication initiation protein [Photobacterium sp. ZSDE20]|uniref:Replication initiation protein n=1 Tax=Photobacterium pectinilyticum TaxID=2906793 RepID=A0ABT1N549_9GAMM|nr:replication initiation protein [Photobacterium sp. ZSDE20]MCQ1058359.1 replication initiation protein [Photobacterium sp. ZSDE20]MDD1827864.1 replication initiation protein [Photobacterium sp. ZSDE20]